MIAGITVMPARKCDSCTGKADTLHCLKCVEKADNKYVINELLAYVSTYVQQSSKVKLIDAVVEHFSADDISAARKVMQEIGQVHIPEYTELHGSRTSSTLRENNVREAEDICGGMTELHNILDRKDYFPQFLAADVSKLPRVAPEELNMMSVMDQLIGMQNEMKSLKSSVEANCLEILQQKTEVSGQETRLKAVEGHTSYASKLKKSKANMPGAGSQNAAAGTPPGTNTQQVAPVAASTSQQVAPSAAATTQPTVGDHVEAKNDGGWQQQGRPGRRQLQGPIQSGDGVRKQRPPAIIGTKAATGRITGGPIDMHIKVWNVNPECESEDIKAYLEEAGLTVKGDAVLFSRPEWNTKSFRMCIPIGEKETAIAPDLWPAGVKVGVYKMYFNERKPRNQNHTE